MTNSTTRYAQFQELLRPIIALKPSLEEGMNLHHQLTADLFKRQQTTNRSSLPLPQPKHYVEVKQWLEQEKLAGNDYLAQAGNNRAQMCRNISLILGWEVDRHILGQKVNNP